MIPTVRKEVDDQWVETYLEMKHGTTLKTKQVLIKYVKDIPSNLPPSEFEKTLNQIVTLEDSSLLDEIIILGQVKAWSFGEVSKEVLDNEISEDKRQKILVLLNEIYRPLAVSGSESLLEISTPIS